LTVWDTLARKQTARIARGSGWSDNVVALAPDGQIIAAPTDKGIQFLQATTLREIDPPLVVSNGVQALAFSRDSRSLWVVADRNLQEWDIATRRLLREQSLPAGYSAVSPLSQQQVFSPDAQTLLLHKQDGSVLLWDTVAARVISSSKGPGWCETFAFSPDGGQVAVPFEVVPGGLPPGKEAAVVPYDTNPGDLRVWESRTGREIQRLTDKVVWTYGLAYSPDGHLLAAGGIDQQVRLWDTSSWREVARLRGHVDEVWTVAFSPDGRSIATGSKDGTVRIWDPIPKKEEIALITLPDPLDSIAFSPQGDFFITVSSGHAEIRACDSLAHSQTQPLPILLQEMRTNWPPFGRPNSTAVAPRATLIAFATQAGTVELWDGPSWHKITELPSESKKPADWLAFSPAGDLLATRESDTEIMRTWSVTNLTKPEPVTTFLPCTNDLCRPVFSPDGRSIATMGADWRTAEIWDLHGKRQAVFQGHKNEVYRLVFSPDGERLGTCSADGTTSVWDVKHPKLPVATLRGQLMNATALAFSPKGQRLAAGNAEGTIKLYDFAREQELLPLRTQKFGECLALFFIDDDTLVARIENNVVVWRAASSAEIAAEELRGETK
jgi:WD40 repeat protein